MIGHVIHVEKLGIHGCIMNDTSSPVVATDYIFFRLTAALLLGPAILDFE